MGNDEYDLLGQGENPVCRITEKYVPLDKYRCIL